MTQRRMCYEMAHRWTCYRMTQRRMCYEMAHTCSQHFFHACAVAGGSHGPSPQRPRPAAGQGPHHQKPKFSAITKSVPGIKSQWDLMEKIRWQFGPTRLHSLTAAGRGSGAREPISPGEGRGRGPIVFRVRYASRSGKFFPGAFALQENNFGPNFSWGRAGTRPHRRYAKSQNFLTITSLVQICFEN